MSTSQTTRYEHVYALIPGPQADTVLVESTADGMTLPSVRVDEDDNYKLYDFSAAFAERYGVAIRKRQSVAQWKAETTDATFYVQVWSTDRLTDDPPRSLHAVPLAHLLTSLTDAALRAALDGWLGEPLHPQAEPWAFPGWYDAATAWLDAALQNLGIQRTGAIRQVKSWPLSCVIEAPTTGGAVFLKAALPLFQREPTITAFLAQHNPDHIPPVLARDDAHGWTLMGDFKAPMLGESKDLALWQATLQLYGQMQQELSREPDALLAAHCIDRRLPTMTALLDSLPAACRALLTEPEHLALVDGLEQRIPALRDSITALETLDIAPSLVHGDFHPFNIAIDGTRPIFFDWTDSALSHPFIDLETALTSPLFEDNPDAAPALIDAYLSAFRPYYRTETLVQAMTLTRPITALYMVISYVWIVEALAPRDRNDMRGALGFWLNRLNEVVAV